MNNPQMELPFGEAPHTEIDEPIPMLHVFFTQVKYDNPALKEDTIAFSCPADVEEEAFHRAVREELAKEGDDQQADAAYDRVAERFGAVWDRLHGDAEDCNENVEKTDTEYDR